MSKKKTSARWQLIHNLHTNTYNLLIQFWTVFFMRLTLRQTNVVSLQLQEMAERYKYCWHIMQVWSYNILKNFTFIRRRNSENLRYKNVVKVKLDQLYLFYANIHGMLLWGHQRWPNNTIFPQFFSITFLANKYPV